MDLYEIKLYGSHLQQLNSWIIGLFPELKCCTFGKQMELHWVTCSNANRFFWGTWACNGSSVGYYVIDMLSIALKVFYLNVIQLEQELPTNKKTSFFMRLFLVGTMCNISLNGNVYQITVHKSLHGNVRITSPEWKNAYVCACVFVCSQVWVCLFAA